MKKITDEQKIILATLFCGLLLILGWIVQKVGFSFYPLIYTLGMLFGGFYQAKNGLIETFHEKKLNVDLLMILAALGACTIHYWFEGAMLTFIFSLSGALEEYTTNQSKKEIANLVNLQPETALLLSADGHTTEVRVDQLTIGATLLVPKGSTIPIDGTLLDPYATIDEAAITGESIPAEKKQHDSLFGGTLNSGNALQMTVTTASQDTLFSKIIRLVNEAQNTPSKTASFIEKIEDRYVKLVLVLVPLMIFLPYLFLGWTWEESFYRGMVLLVVASPCALVASATPATLAAISNGAKNGVLFKGGIFLEKLADLKAIAFDKTGTLTNGKPIVTDHFFLDKEATPHMVNIVSAIERQSTHPLADALYAFFKEESTDSLPELEINDLTGLGMSAQEGSTTWRIGKESFALQQALQPAIYETISQLQEQGKTIIFLSANYQLVGYFALLDVPKASAKATIAYFRSQNIHTTMITGDQKKTAEAIATKLTIDEVHANCLPEEKTRIIKEQQATYGINAMVGDGVNDAPALANSSIGIAMGQGTDIAIDIADVVLMQNDLEKLQTSHELSLKLKKIVTQNIVFSVFVISLLILSNFFQMVSLPLGVIGHEGSTILVILNGLRLLKQTPKKASLKSTKNVHFV